MLNAYTDKEKVSFWQNVQPGNFITVSASEVMMRSSVIGQGFAPIEREVNQIYVMKEMNGLAEWRAFHLADDPDYDWIWVKIVDDNVDVKLCWENEPEDYTPGDRQDMVEEDNAWLFSSESIDAYLDSQNVDVLMYTPEMQTMRHMENINDSNDAQMFAFGKKGNMEFNCSCEEIPDLSGTPDLLATVAEYVSDDPNCPDPELIVFEMGAEESDVSDENKRGGLIRILHGMNISLAEIEVLG